MVGERIATGRRLAATCCAQPSGTLPVTRLPPGHPPGPGCENRQRRGRRSFGRPAARRASGAAAA
eukprot:4699672-Alexandrium_andersonii.AAC.1